MSSPENTTKQVAEISVVILAYKEGAVIESFTREMQSALEKRGLSYQLVIVSNFWEKDRGSDHTPEIIRRLASGDPRIVAVSKAKTGGMGWDLRTGFNEATGRTVGFIDGDGQMPAEDIIKVYDALTAGSYDFAKTYRVVRGDGIQRGIISFFYNLLLKLMFPKVKAQDANSKPKIFTREAFERFDLRSDGWFIDAEMVIQGSYLGMNISEVPTVFRENQFRRSLIGIKAIFEFIANLVLYRLNRMHELRR